MIPFGVKIMEVPIYRETENEYYEYLRKVRIKYEGEWIERMVRMGIERDEAEKDIRNMPHSFNKAPTWEYNRIVGWIVIFAIFGTIKADWWFIDSKRVSRRLAKKVFEHVGKLSDVCSTYGKTNVQIREEIIEFFEVAKKGEFSERLRKYHIDMELLLQDIKYIDFRSLIDDIINQSKQRNRSDS